MISALSNGDIQDHVPKFLSKTIGKFWRSSARNGTSISGDSYIATLYFTSISVAINI